MRKVTVSAKTVDEAISKALQQLETTKDKVKVTILEEPTKGLFGLIGTRPALIEVEKVIDPIEEAKKFLQDVTKNMDVDVKIEVFKREDAVLFNLVGKGLGLLIGHHGQTLDALQYLVNTVANRYAEGHIRIVLDAEQYRDKRKAALEELADRLARKVARTRQAIKLEPMSAHERKIIHTHLQDDPYVDTYSEGEEPHRCIVISLRKKIN